MTGNQPCNDDDRETQTETGREREGGVGGGGGGVVEGQGDEKMTEKKADIKNRKKTSGKTQDKQR